MSKTTLVTQQVQLQEWFHMMQESKGRPQQIPLDEWCKENYGISAAGYYYSEYSYAAEPPVQFRLSHLSRRSEPL